MACYSLFDFFFYLTILASMNFGAPITDNLSGGSIVAIIISGT
jgi:hypothetical protein